MNRTFICCISACAWMSLSSSSCFADDVALDQAQTWAVESTAFAEAAAASCDLTIQPEALDGHLGLAGLDRRTAEEKFAPVFAKEEAEFRSVAARTGGLRECLAAYDLLGPNNLNIVVLPLSAAEQLTGERLLSHVPTGSAGQ